jgi:FHA domain-containing protein
MSMTLIVIVAAVVLVLLLLGVGVLVFVLKSRGGKETGAGAAPAMQQFPQAGAPPTSYGTPDQGAPASWPPPQQQPQQWAGAPGPAEPSMPQPQQQPDWGSFPEPAPPMPPPPPSYMPASEPDPYATTPSADMNEPLLAPDLFMTTPSTPRQTAQDLAPAHLKADDGSVIQLNRTTMRVGRHPECDVVIPTPGTSRQHAELEFRDGAWVISDLNSGNGTFVNNVRVRTQQLSPGDEIRIDQTRFTFSAGA